MTVTALLIPTHGLTLWLWGSLSLEILKWFQEHSLANHGIEITNEHITSLLWSAFVDFLSLLCTLYGTFICSKPEENSHLASFTISFIIFYGYLYAIRFTFMEIIILCLIVPMIGFCFRSNVIMQEEPKKLETELIDLLKEGYCKKMARRTSDQCIICMREYEEYEKVILMPCDRRHRFHEACILTWLERSSKCPMCNTKLTTELFNRAKILESTNKFELV